MSLRLVAGLLLPAAAAGGLTVVAGQALPASAVAPRHYGYEVIRAYPHDAAAFTQGLVYSDGGLFESTGLRGRSSVRRVRLETGAVERMRTVPARYFGLALWNGQLLQLTWTSGVGLVYDAATFEPAGLFTYTGEGWGLAFDGRRLVMSDGTEWLRFLDPATRVEIGRVEVTADGEPVRLLNELEVIDNSIYANVWQTDRIAIIAPDTGRVEGWIDLKGLLPPAQARDADVLNGIAWDPDGRRLFVTGKLWPTLYEIRLVPQ